jgi:hypothetical protein
MSTTTLHEDEVEAVETPHIESHLCPLEAAAKHYLSRFVARVLVRTQRRKYELLNQTADRWPHSLPNDAPPTALVAAEVLRHMHALREALEKQEAVMASWHALNVGLLGERFQTALVHEETRRAG